MFNQHHPVRKIVTAASMVLAVVLLGFLINAPFQARRYYGEIAPRATFAAFLRKDTAVSSEVVRERIIGVEHVAEVRFIPQNEVYETALRANPALKDILVTGEVPFVAYFLIRPDEVSRAAAESIQEAVRGIEGIEEVRYDAATFLTGENLKKFSDYYRIVLSVVFLIGVFFVAGKFIWSWSYGLVDYRRSLAVLVEGILAGIAGGGIYYLLAYVLLSAAVIQIPASHIPVFIVGGIWIAFMGEQL